MSSFLLYGLYKAVLVVNRNSLLYICIYIIYNIYIYIYIYVPINFLLTPDYFNVIGTLLTLFVN